jgi:hypothetical protein
MGSHSKLVEANHSSTATVTLTVQEMWKHASPHQDMPFSWQKASFLGNLVSSLLSLFPQQKPSVRLSPKLFAKPRGSEACLPKLKPLRIFEDSQPAIKLTINQASSNRTKQMDSLNLWVRRSGGTSSRSCASHNVTTMRPQRFESSASLVSNQGLHFGTSIDQSEGGGCVCTMSSLGLALTMAHLCIRQKNVCLSIA